MRMAIKDYLTYKHFLGLRDKPNLVRKDNFIYFVKDNFTKDKDGNIIFHPQVLEKIKNDSNFIEGLQINVITDLLPLVEGTKRIPEANIIETMDMKAVADVVATPMSVVAAAPKVTILPPAQEKEQKQKFDSDSDSDSGFVLIEDIDSDFEFVSEEDAISDEMPARIKGPQLNFIMLAEDIKPRTVQELSKIDSKAFDEIERAAYDKSSRNRLIAMIELGICLREGYGYQNKKDEKQGQEKIDMAYVLFKEASDIGHPIGSEMMAEKAGLNESARKQYKALAESQKAYVALLKKYKYFETLAHKKAYVSLEEVASLSTSFNVQGTIPLEEDGRRVRYTVHEFPANNTGLVCQVLVSDAEVRRVKVIFQGTYSRKAAGRDIARLGVGYESFVKEQNRMLQFLEDQIKGTFSQANEPIMLTIAGHSLGGADTQNFTRLITEIKTNSNYQKKYPTIAKISNLQIFTENSPGVPDHVAREFKKFAEIIPRTTADLKIEAYIKHVGGDLVQQAGETHLFDDVASEHVKVHLLKLDVKSINPLDAHSFLLFDDKDVKPSVNVSMLENKTMAGRKAISKELRHKSRVLNVHNVAKSLSAGQGLSSKNSNSDDIDVLNYMLNNMCVGLERHIRKHDKDCDNKYILDHVYEIIKSLKDKTGIPVANFYNEKLLNGYGLNQNYLRHLAEQFRISYENEVRGLPNIETAMLNLNEIVNNYIIFLDKDRKKKSVPPSPSSSSSQPPASVFWSAPLAMPAVAVPEALEIKLAKEMKSILGNYDTVIGTSASSKKLLVVDTIRILEAFIKKEPIPNVNPGNSLLTKDYEPTAVYLEKLKDNFKQINNGLMGFAAQWGISSDRSAHYTKLLDKLVDNYQEAVSNKPKPGK